MSEIKKWDGTKVLDADKPFIIDPITREISTKSEKRVIIQNDHNSERFTFEVPRFVEKFDLGNCNVVQIYYINGSKPGNSATGIYTVDDMMVYPFVNNKLIFTWLISRNATAIPGTLSFMVRFASMDDDGVVKYAWNTNIYNGVRVVDSIDSDDVFEEEYVDVIQQWKNEVLEELRGFSNDMIVNHVDVAQIRTNETNISTLTTEQAVLKSRMDTFTSLPSGSTSGNAELTDIRVDYNGTTHSTAGDAVRAQATLLNNGLSTLLQRNDIVNPFQPLTIDRHYYYKGSDGLLPDDVLTTPQYNAINLDGFKAWEDQGVNTNYGVGARLLTPVPALLAPDGEYVIVIKTDKAFDAVVYLGYHATWAPNNTYWGKNVSLKTGYNAIIVDGGFSHDAQQTEFRFVYMRSGSEEFVQDLGITEFEMYLIRGNAFVGYINQAIDEAKDFGRYSEQAGTALNSINAGAVRLPITHYMTNIIPSGPESGTYSLEETLTGYRFRVSDEHHIAAGNTKWFQAFVTELGVKRDVVKKTLLLDIASNNPDCTIQSLARLALHNARSNWNGAVIEPGVVKVSDVNLSAYADDDIIYLIWGVAAGSHNNPQWNQNTVDMTMSMMEKTEGYVTADELVGFDPADYYPREYIDSLMVDEEKKIICWGDSLTAMGGWPEKLASLSGMTVVNCGTGGENSDTIAARQGADCIIIDNFTIPANVISAQISDYATKFTTYMGKTVSPLLQSGKHVNPCMIGDVEGTLAWTGSSYNDQNGVWNFTRSIAGTEVVINRPTQLTTFADRTYNNGTNIHLFFIGTNDGAFNTDEMIKKLRMMIDHCKTNEYLILGLTRIMSEQYKEKFKAEFGRKWLDLHGYLVAYGLEDSGLTATSEDTAAINRDEVPPSLLMDAVHYTNKTRDLIGIQVYNRLRDLHYFN